MLIDTYSACGGWRHNTAKLNSRFFLRLGKTRKSVPENKDETKGANSISEEDSVFSNFFLLCRRLLFCV